MAFWSLQSALRRGPFSWPPAQPEPTRPRSWSVPARPCALSGLLPAAPPRSEGRSVWEARRYGGINRIGEAKRRFKTCLTAFGASQISSFFATPFCQNRKSRHERFPGREGAVESFWEPWAGWSPRHIERLARCGRGVGMRCRTRWRCAPRCRPSRHPSSTCSGTSAC